MTFERVVVRKLEEVLRSSLSDVYLEIATHPGAKVFSYDYELELSGFVSRIVRVRFLPALNSEYGRNRMTYPFLPVEIGVEVYANAPDDVLEQIRLSERSKLALRRAFFDCVKVTALFQTVSHCGFQDGVGVRHSQHVTLALDRTLLADLRLWVPNRNLQQAAPRWDDGLMSFADAFTTATMHLGFTREQWILKLADLFTGRGSSFIGDRGLEELMHDPMAAFCLNLRPSGHTEIGPWDALPSSRQRTPVQEPAAPVRASRGVLGPIRRRIDL